MYAHAEETIDLTWDHITHLYTTQRAFNGTHVLCRYIYIHVYTHIYSYIRTHNVFIHVYAHAEETIDLTWDHIAHLYTTQRAFNGTLVPAHATGRNSQYSSTLSWYMRRLGSKQTNEKFHSRARACCQHILQIRVYTCIYMCMDICIFRHIFMYILYLCVCVYSLQNCSQILLLFSLPQKINLGLIFEIQPDCINAGLF